MAVVVCVFTLIARVPMKLVRLNKKYMNETYRRVPVVKHLYDLFLVRNGLKQGNSLSPLLFNLALGYAISRVQVNQNGLKLIGTHQLLFYADDISVLGGNVHTIKKNAEALVVACKETGIEVNADKTKYLVLYRDKNAVRSHS